MFSWEIYATSTAKGRKINTKENTSGKFLFIKLIVKQKQAIRTICNATYRAHTAPLFKQQKILPIEKLIQFSRIKYMHSYHFNLLPPSFTNTWLTNIERNPERALRRVEFVKRLPLYTFTLAWNSAPGGKMNPRQHLYLKELKSILLSSL